MINLKFISQAEIVISVDKVLSENMLYKPINRGKYVSLILSPEVREYKEKIKFQCVESDFHDYLSYLRSSYSHLVIKSQYTFSLPMNNFFTQGGDLGTSDVTNMVKAVEDTLIGEIIDDRYVIENTVIKNPSYNDHGLITAEFNFFSFNPSEVLNLLLIKT